MKLKGLFAPGAPEPNSGIYVILAALCVIFTIFGVAIVAGYIWRHCRRHSAAAAPSPKKGLREDDIRSLPMKVAGSSSSPPAECPICLAEFQEGEEVRVLPQCGHEFHVRCVDTWLASHSSCPSCRRRVLLVGGRRAAAESSSIAIAASSPS